MIKSRKVQLVIGLIIACVTASVIGQEPNLAKAELQFEIGREEQKWITDIDRMGEMGLRGRIEKSVIRPTHVAVMCIKHVRVPIIYWTEISNNPIGRTMSKRQKEFIAEANGRIRNLHRIEEGFKFRWYAVSQEDAKKMTQAFIDVWNSKVDAKLQPLLKRRKELEEKIAEIKKELPEKQKQFKAAESKYKEIKNIRYFVSLHDGEVYTKAKETMFQMDKTLDTLEIELAGIREKMKTIEQLRKGQEPVRNQTNQVNYRLDEMFVEQMVELRGVEARKKAALRIRNREKTFLYFFSQWSSLDSEADGLERNLSESEKDLSRLEGRLANPELNMLPPKVYQNKVTIYPVKVED